MKNQTRARTALTGVAIAGVLVAGCSSTEPDDGADGGAVELQVVGMSSQRAALEMAFELYTAEHPETTFSLTTAEADQYNTAIRAQMNGSNAPDLMMVFPGNGNATSVQPLAEAGLLTDLSDRDWVSDVPESFQSLNQVDGATYIRSMGYGTIGTVYNIDAFAELGLEIPETWDDLLNVCEVIKDNGKIPMALGLATGWNTQLVNYGFVASTVYGPDPEFTERQIAGDETFAESEGWNEAFDKYLELRDGGCFIDGAEGTTYDQAKEAVASEQALMLTMVLDGVPGLRELNTDINYGMFPLPAVDSAEDVYVPIGVGPGLGVNANSKNQEVALDFIDFLATPEVIQKWADELGIIPGIEGADVVLAEGFEPMAEKLSSGAVATYPDQLWPNSEVQQSHFAAVQSAYTDIMSVKDALALMDQAFQTGG